MWSGALSGLTTAIQQLDQVCVHWLAIASSVIVILPHQHEQTRGILPSPQNSEMHPSAGLEGG
jgi:hypothetical protein